MKSFGRAILAVVAAMALTFVLLFLVEGLSAIVHPFPPHFDGNIPAHVKRYPQWFLGVVVLLWGGTATAATWVASKIGGRAAGIVAALLLAWALTFNLTNLPYVPWFKITMFSAFPGACWFGLKYGRRNPAAASTRRAAPIAKA